MSPPAAGPLLGLLLLGLGAAGALGQTKISYQTKWFAEQLVDHFSWSNQDTWSQRYLVNADHWCGPKCPVLFYCGNEGDIEVFTNNTGFMWENAAGLRALLVFAEHRFYGQSMPYQINPRRVAPDELAKLGYLSSEQALADYARLIHELRHGPLGAGEAPFIALGGSYGGMLAAWLRMKYPNAVQGALAGSAPILQFPGQYDCRQFNRIVTKDFENYSANCSRSIARSWSVMRELAQTGAGLRQLSSIFNSCKRLQSAQDVDQLAEVLAAIWVNMAMTDYANAATFLSDMPAYPIGHACAHLAAEPLEAPAGRLLAGVAAAAQVYTNYTGRAPCLDVQSYLLDPMDVLWDFQACTEMVMPICSDGVDDMFEPQPFNVSQFARDCRRRWGVRTQPRKVETLYGDRRLAAASRIIFSTCSRDPWSAGCPQESAEERDIFAIKVPGACHHEDLRPAGPGDTPALKSARRDELRIIAKWIEAHYAATGAPAAGWRRPAEAPAAAH